MSTMLIRMYDTAGTAAKVAQHLSDDGFQHVSQFKAGGSKSLVGDLMAAHVWKSHAEVYAERLGKGGGLVVVHAPFGSAAAATDILDAYNPVDAGLPLSHSHKDYAWDDAAPLSSILRMPVLTNTRLPAETFSGISSLTRGTAFLSNLLGIPLLSRGSAQKQSSFGLPLLSRSPTPLSSMFGMKTLSSNPTPLSSLFGMKVLRGK